MIGVYFVEERIFRRSPWYSLAALPIYEAESTTGHASYVGDIEECG